MKIAVLRMKLRAPWVHSLKEKRMEVKSLLAKIRNKFQVSAAEVEDQDIHQSIVIGVAAIVPHKAQADSMMEAIVDFVEENTEAMTEALSTVKSGQVTYAVRDTSLDGRQIKAGDIMGLSDKTIETVGSDVTETTIDLIKKLMDDSQIKAMQEDLAVQRAIDLLAESAIETEKKEETETAAE